MAHKGTLIDEIWRITEMHPIGETGVAEKVRLGWFSGENLAIVGWASPRDSRTAPSGGLAHF